MTINHVLAVAPVSDFDASRQWYERLFNRSADNYPMEGSLVEWRVADTGWIQVFHDTEHAGTAMINFAVDDLGAHIADLTNRGLTSGPIETANKNVQLSTITDPDGNRITFIGNFRVNY